MIFLIFHALVYSYIHSVCIHYYEGECWDKASEINRHNYDVYGFKANYEFWTTEQRGPTVIFHRDFKGALLISLPHA